MQGQKRARLHAGGWLQQLLHLQASSVSWFVVLEALAMCRHGYDPTLPQQMSGCPRASWDSDRSMKIVERYTTLHQVQASCCRGCATSLLIGKLAQLLSQYWLRAQTPAAPAGWADAFLSRCPMTLSLRTFEAPGALRDVARPDLLLPLPRR